ncbi:MAG: aconitate hydratase [Spirochaetales bacterium]|nr:aconitate hydratase [Spirochaetales bacterium]
MKGTMTGKIIGAHCVDGEMTAGREVGIGIDQTLTQDATGTLVYLQFETMNIKRVRTELSVSYVDHNTLQTDHRNMDDHIYLQTVAAKYGIYFSRPGNGICHQIHLERFGIPGKTLLGSDSHTPTAGGLGMLAIGAGGVDVAVAMAGAPFYVTMPEVVGVKLTGRLDPLCSAKDVILTILGRETVKGGVGKVYEYFGEGVATLSVTERATIANMGAELGATSSIFPSDKRTREFLALQKREKDFIEIGPDKDALYERLIEINLADIVPMVAQPHMPDKVVPVEQLKGLPVQQVMIGSCTNSSINDLGIAADILGGKVVPETISLGISPGSRQVFRAAIEAGIISRLVGSGARILELACGPCIGMGFAPGSGIVSVRTNNRNFKARCGSKEALVYLASPETAAATALTGYLTDPRTIEGVRRKDYSRHVVIDDSMITPPPEKGENVEVVKGPNIKPCPQGKALPEGFVAEVVIKTGDNITTDHIMPAGAAILPLRSNIPEIAKHVFEIVDPDFYRRAEKADIGIIVGGENYGQGSSREHAALAPMYLGVKAVVAKSFARIHKTNLVNFGILPFTFLDPADYDGLEAGDRIAFPKDLKEILRSGRPIEAEVANKGITIGLSYELSGRFIDIILAGGRLSYTVGR